MRLVNNLKKPKKLLALILAIFLIVLVIYTANEFCGNPFSKNVVRKAAETYLKEKYDDKDFVIDEINYNFKDTTYVVHVKSLSSEDSHFILSVNKDGSINYDYYESYVEEKFNVYNRLDSEYRALVDTLLENDFTYDSKIAYGTLDIVKEENSEFPFDNENVIKMEDLVLDYEYDIKDIASKCGKVVIYLENEDVSFEKASELLLDIKKQFDDKGIPFASINFTLENDSDKRINVASFPYKDINDNDLISKLKQADKELNDYYESVEK